MTHLEVIEALLDGKKITKTSWEKSKYMHLVDDYFIDGNGNRTICVFSDNENLGEFLIFKEMK